MTAPLLKGLSAEKVMLVPSTRLSKFGPLLAGIVRLVDERGKM